MDTKNKGFSEYGDIIEKTSIDDAKELLSHGWSILYIGQRSHNDGYDDQTGYMIMHEIVYVLGKHISEPPF